MKKVKMVCPTNAPIWVTETHAEAIMNHPANAVAKWRIAADENEKDAATKDNTRNSGTAEKEPQPKQPIQGSKSRRKVAATQQSES
jgi:hypothetical protein